MSLDPISIRRQAGAALAAQLLSRRVSGRRVPGKRQFSERRLKVHPDDERDARVDMSGFQGSPSGWNGDLEVASFA